MKHKIEITDFSKNHTLTNLRVNKSETLVAFFVNTVDMENNCYKKDIVIMELKSFSKKTLILDILPDDFMFCEDKLVLISNQNNTSLLYYYNLNTDELMMHSIIPYKVKDFCVLNGTIYFSAIIQINNKDDLIKCGTEVPFYKEGIGFSSQNRNCLFKIDGETLNINRLTALNIDIDDIVFDFENSRIAFTAFHCDTIKPIASDIYTYDLKNRIVKKWTNGMYRISYIDILTSEKLIFTGVDLKVKNRNDDQNIYVIDMSKEDCQEFIKSFSISNEFPGTCTDSRSTTTRPIMTKNNSLYFLNTERNRETLNEVSENGDILTFETGLKTIDCYQILIDGILLIGFKDLGLHELYFFSNKKLTQLTQYNEWLIKEKKIGIPEPVKIYDENKDIDGWLIPPIDIEPNKQYPGILMIHGGPKLIYSDIYHHTMQLLSANGYFVFYANPKGSSGRGDEFLNIRGNFGNIAHEQLMNFVDKVIEIYPQINRKTLGVTGYSYGGYMTNYIITRTNRFKAAVSESGISNLITAFTSSDIGYQYVTEYMNNETPWSAINAYIEASPITKANHATTPTLFIHGKADNRCHYTESLNMYTALNFHGIKTKLCLMDVEDHGMDSKGKPCARKHRYLEILRWFDAFLKADV